MSPSPASILPAWVKGFHAVALAAISEEGRVLEANEGFTATFAGIDEGVATSNFIEPTFHMLRQAAPREDGVVYEGMMKLGAAGGVQRAFTGRVYRKGATLFVAVEMDISVFEQLNDEVTRLKQELEETRKQLARRNHALQNSLEELQLAKQRDSLTGLPTRVALDTQMAEEIQRWERSRRPLALLLIDMDNYDRINAEYGRETGDEVLKHVATLVGQAVRSMDIAVRYGGQEFAILLPETNEMGALIVAERLRMDLEGQLILPLLEPATASFGVAIYLGGEAREEFYARAWRALKHAKVHGKNAISMAGVVAECDHLYQGGFAPQGNV